MSFTIDSSDHRSIKAIEIAGDAGQWARVTTRDGRQVYGVPSQRDAHHLYFVDLNTCTCEDFRRYGLSDARLGQSGEHGLCKHIRAVRLFTELSAAVEDRTAGGHRRHLNLVPKEAARSLCDRHGVIAAADVVRED